MDLMKIIPWGLSAVLAIVCWQQNVTINALEQKKIDVQKDVLTTATQRPIKQDEKQLSPTSSRSAAERKKSRRERKKSALLAMDRAPTFDEGRQSDVSEEDLEALVEERAWQRVEQIEEDRQQERVERIKGYIEDRVNGWGDRMEWEQSTQEDVLQLMISSFEERMAIRQQARNGEIERDEARQISDDLREERDTEIRQIIGEEQFTELEEELQQRGPPR